MTQYYMTEKPQYCSCKSFTDCWCISYELNSNYKGKYFRKECGNCWRNTIKPERKDADRSKIRVHKNSSVQSCPICDEQFKEHEYVVNLGFRRRQVLVHPKCIGAFIDKLIKFKKEELPNIIEKLTVEAL